VFAILVFCRVCKSADYLIDQVESIDISGEDLFDGVISHLSSVIINIIIHPITVVFLKRFPQTLRTAIQDSIDTFELSDLVLSLLTINSCKSNTSHTSSS